MFQIGEFSKITKVSVRMLKYYNKCGILKPKELNDWTGYRYYKADQIDYFMKLMMVENYARERIEHE